MATPAEKGRSELSKVRRESRALYWSVGLFSLFINMLTLTGPIFMLQVYDRVLGSRSEETLAALVVLIAFLFLMMGILDFARARVMSRVGARFQAKLDRRVFAAVMARSSLGAAGAAATSGSLRDLEAVQRLLSAPVFLSLYDLPFVPLFLLGIALFHPWLGILAMIGGGILVIAAIMNQLGAAHRLNEAQALTVRSELMAGHIQTEAEMVRSLGMLDNAFVRWNEARARGMEAGIRAGDTSGLWTTFSRTFRMFLQSAMLGLAALLVLRAEATAGVMIASSILLGRALAPIEQLIGNWPLLQRARRGWASLCQLLGEVPEAPPRVALPRPKAHLVIQQLTVVPPGQSAAVLRVINAELRPGQALGVIGPSGSGKSTLARCITGVWKPAGGLVRLGGATLDQFDPAVLGQYIGYLPQRVQLFDGTIAENIARLGVPDDAAVVAAAEKAGADQLIRNLPDGYNTRVSAGGGLLSGGQMQRIGLARAMYGDPVLLVLDEPNSNLDNDGSKALNIAIAAMKADGGSVIIMAHRPSAIQQCEMLLVLEAGSRRAFGPTQEVLREVLANARAVIEAPEGGGGVS